MAQTPPTPPAATRRPSALSAMRYPIFRRVWFASVSSHFGGMIQSVGASWLMLSIAQSADMVALVQASVALPVMLFSLVAGAMADNFDRRRMMLAAQVFMLVVSVTLSIFAWSGVITPWLLLLFTFLIGCGAAFNSPAWQASVGDMVPRGELPGAVAFNSMGFNIARSVGPAVGGAIVAAAGAAAAFAINAVSYVALVGRRDHVQRTGDRRRERARDGGGQADDVVDRHGDVRHVRVEQPGGGARDGAGVCLEGEAGGHGAHGVGSARSTEDRGRAQDRSSSSTAAQSSRCTGRPCRA